MDSDCLSPTQSMHGPWDWIQRTMMAWSYIILVKMLDDQQGFVSVQSNNPAFQVLPTTTTGIRKKVPPPFDVAFVRVSVGILVPGTPIDYQERS